MFIIKKEYLLKKTENEKIERDQYLFLQVYGKYKNQKINSFPLIKYFIE
jgi:hypothetical protein